MDLWAPVCGSPCCRPPSLPPAFQEIFKLFSPSPTGTVDMRSMRAALRHVGIQLSPQEMCEALRQADLDGGCPHPWPLVPPPLLALEAASSAHRIPGLVLF